MMVALPLLRNTAVTAYATTKKHTAHAVLIVNRRREQ